MGDIKETEQLKTTVDDMNAKDMKGDHNMPLSDSKKETIQESLLKNIRNPSLKRISFRAGCKRLESETYDELRTSMYDHLRLVLHQSLLAMQHGRRNTLTLDDILYALRNHNHSCVYV